MTVDVTGLVKGLSMPVAFSEIVEIPEVFLVSDKNVNVHIDGTITNVDDCFSLDGVLKATLQYNCDKCLCETSYPLVTEVHEKFSDAEHQSNQDNSEDEEEEIWSFTNKTIHLRPVVQSILLTNLPAKVLCVSDCKGLCYICGHNLNIGECGCDTTYIDPRFEGLRSLFQDKEV